MDFTIFTLNMNTGRAEILNNVKESDGKHLFKNAQMQPANVSKQNIHTK